MVARTPRNKSKSPPAKQQALNKPLSTSKGQFSFTMVTDGCYIEHKWGNNSGHIGVPLEAIPGFIGKLEALYAKTTGQTPRDKSKSPGGPKGIAKGGKAAKEQKSAEKKKKEKKEPPAKPTLEDLDAELMNYTAARGAESEEAAPAEA